MKKGADFGPDFPMKGWELDIINDTAFNKPKKGRCDYCHANLRYEYCLTHADTDFYLVVGRECVNSFSDAEDIEAARAFFDAEWSQRRHYYWKKAHGRTWVVKRSQYGHWSVAYAPSVESAPSQWVWGKSRHRTFDAAKDAVRKIVFKGHVYVEANFPFRREDS